MKKARHHFVPKFYLRLFPQNDRQINLFNINREQVFHGASIRRQCYRHKLYSENEDLENAFMDFETTVAPVMKKIIRNRSIPERHSDDWIPLMYFIAFQHLRTDTAKKESDEFIDLSVKAVLEEDSRVDNEELRRIVVGHRYSLEMVLSAAPDFAYGISDLEARLVYTEDAQGFCTSDNPVIIYNQYCEGVKGLGVLGAVCSGLQIFLPLDPHITLCMFDRKIYALRKGKHDVALECERVDVDWMNLFQMTNAEENVYYHSGYSEDEMCRLLATAKKHRNKPKTKIGKADGTHPEEKSVLIHMHRPHRGFKLNLSFMRIRRRARRIPLPERGSMYRKTIGGVRGSGRSDRQGRKTTSWVARKK